MTGASAPQSSALSPPHSPRLGGVDLYVGGVEHAVLHLLYARFWHKILFDLGHVSTPEPFQRLFNQGYIQAAAYKDVRGAYVPAEEVEERENETQIDVARMEMPSGEVEPLRQSTRFYWEGQPVFREFGKMGKSLKNAVTPDDICTDYGCDTMRIYEMSMGPLEASKPWNTRDIVGAHRFLQRAWRCIIDEQTGQPRVSDAAPDAALARTMHKTIVGVRRDMETLGFNTAVAKLIEFVNDLTKAAAVLPIPRACAETLALLLAPLAPHIAEDLWSRLGHETTLAFHAFPVADETLAADDQIEIPVQVPGQAPRQDHRPGGQRRQGDRSCSPRGRGREEAHRGQVDQEGDCGAGEDDQPGCGLKVRITSFILEKHSMRGVFFQG